MNFNFLKKANKMMINPTTKVYRQKTVEGFSIPAIIRNGSYFFVDLDVYEDGRVNCWNFEDFEHFKKDVRRGWVRLNIPDNEEISIHSLGAWTITDGAWIFTPESFIDYVLSLVKKLNPKLENIYQYSEKKINGVSIGEDGSSSVYREHKRTPDDVFPDKIDGKSLNLFYKVKEEYHLTKVNIFSDQTLRLSRLEETVELTLQELEELIAKKIIVTEVPALSRVHIYGLGSFTIKQAEYTADINQKRLEIRDIVGKLNGEPTSIQLCRQAYTQYINDPTPSNKERLKITYENVPDHNKMYVGDMDTKDIEVRMIIYGEQEIERWSHYQVAKARGEKLPTISIPKTKDDTP
ncbi:DUF7638 domain-containing protein [Chitinophaga ginsengisegetis]|uniref:DUF7638 domain-containing protein n=1 Tax=Chitinophaga ginsengisegetis TaxID=393003 RepID=UPI000DB901E0|nr:hypothetical protein [Chitinophaga ginsengisegetis]MDR6568822.1 hypothetical protein [Chitinophaga ginsengisegetis]MDR6647946.1 hypothetical protein [Chitinophaga ginsengisegetis]MDR6654903.1 hypothetical protein [Chitinophaga ginsengisegetis]